MLITTLLIVIELRFLNVQFDMMSIVDIIELFFYGVFSSIIALFLNKSFSEKKNHYRIAVVFPLVIYTVLLMIFTHNELTFQSLKFLLAVAVFTFLGSFITSNITKGFWENNAPPSESIQEQVLIIHNQHMGIPGKNLFKRLMDIMFALTSIIISLPIWIIVTLLIWWVDPGPVLFVKNSVGLGGKNFKQFKFRSMVLNAEEETGPISGYENDERELPLGHFLRKTALDELPQLFNILRGDMSYVGPRPQRTILVFEYLQRLPEYAVRHRVRPGLAGLAQVADSYHITPEEKLAWDLEYINRVNTWFDLKIIFSAFLLVFVLRWRAESNPESAIRKLLKTEKAALRPNHQ
jgi:lipopolysaccharide/colanic/teichoic acid biosynthesis glycosyltransferase